MKVEKNEEKEEKKKEATWQDNRKATLSQGVSSASD